MPRARISLDAAYTTAPVPHRLFGSFVEHMGRCVYTGIFEPDHPSADADGLRSDVLELVREIGPTVVRYPGGNFVSGYDWEDGVGPVEERPRRIDRAWRTVETNAFGLDEFSRWADKAGTEIMYAVNLGTRGLQEACDVLEYANHPSGTKFSDLRRSHGRQDPYGIKLWCLGNEMDGPWQTGHKTAHEYARLAGETARAMRQVDPTIELVACGSSSRSMPTFGEWERIVLEETYEDVQMISAHAYYEESETTPLADFLASAVDMDVFIDSVAATADAVGAKLKSRKKIGISFDEWNVWNQTAWNSSERAKGRTAWDVAPRVIEDEYTVQDAVVVGTLLNSLLRHGDRVLVGCQAQLVNVIGLLRSEAGGPAWKQTIALPFEQVRRRSLGGHVLDVRTTSDRYETGKYGDVDLVDASAVLHHDDDGGLARVTLFLANRSLEESAETTVALGGFAGDLAVGDALVLAAADGQDRYTSNTESSPTAVGLRPLASAGGSAALEAGERGAQTARITLPALSWAVVELVPASSAVR
ncbi:arabinosylfuranosidase ArfA [Quadrisphaera setariae]|uniref:non-reducing end alpha-L-arabinofuranosidase n=1 Tax=Quadrisphaera setariae TaxID=2593304 RepID=A0A5C8ZHX9_9ACTN|nr:alpha-L-arabinofuranosidase C-terminal domain-containing protein [Quadrisphaera setariae]TXR56759.1 alpha-L-arabinofuranosidase [Quadrisphaera setariae]